MNLYHNTWKWFPFKTKVNQTNHQFKIAFNILKRFVLGIDIEISSWYVDIEIKFIVFHILIEGIFRKGRLQ